ncbi:MAG: DEAD/DEAH box helicase [Candidatus Saccharimonadales bacterium]
MQNAYHAAPRSKSRPSRGRSFGGNNNRRSGGFGGNRRSGGSRKPKGQYIDPIKFVKAAQPVEMIAYESKHQFADFAVNDLIKANLAAKGYVTPSAIQDQAIPEVLSGRDVIGLANTGTGKTAAFAVPLFHALMEDKSAHALVIAPTRELAQQIEDECRSIAKGSGLRGALLIGGTPMKPQLRDLSGRPRIVIGTPGRIKDHLQRGSLELNDFTHIVLDEVDRMLDMGFLPDVQFILDSIQPEHQSLFFSATMDARVSRLIESFSRDPVTVSVKSGDTSSNVHQDVVIYGSHHEKIEKLHDILNKHEVEKVIIFDETQRNVERLGNDLIERGFKADAIHGGKTQGQRQRALNRFKKSEVVVLVATDVAARGIDVSDITHVINYAIPQTYDDYTHRVGRAGRAGRTGYALTFVGRDSL